jgi:hypothetical protein
LEPLLSWPGRLDLALHIDPIPTPVAAARLRTQRARFESSRRADEQKGRLPARRSRPPLTMPPTSPSGWPAGRRSCSASGCT